VLLELPSQCAVKRSVGKVATVDRIAGYTGARCRSEAVAFNVLKNDFKVEKHVIFSSCESG
jgi:hypothetical protein